MVCLSLSLPHTRIYIFRDKSNGSSDEIINKTVHFHDGYLLIAYCVHRPTRSQTIPRVNSDAVLNNMENMVFHSELVSNRIHTPDP